jgi:hypothetical protein
MTAADLGMQYRGNSLNEGHFSCIVLPPALAQNTGVTTRSVAVPFCHDREELVLLSLCAHNATCFSFCCGGALQG